MVVLWDDVVWTFLEFAGGMVVEFDGILEAWEKNFHQLLELYGLRIVHCDNEFISNDRIVDWAIEHSVILLTNGAGSNQRSLDANAGQFFENQVVVDHTALSHGSREVLNIVVGNMLSGGSRDSIMMLVDAHVVEDGCLGPHDLVDFFFVGVLLNDGLGELSVGSVYMSLAISDLLFGSLSGCEIAGPAVFWVIAVRHHVIVADWPSEILGLKGIEVLSWGRVHDVDVCRVVLVEVLNDSIHVLEVHSSICKGEIASEWDHDVVSSEGILKFVDVVKEFLHLPVSIEGVEIFVDDNWIVVVKSLIVPHTRGPAVVILHDSGEDFLLLSEMLGEWPPQIVECFLVDSSVFVLTVKSGKPPGFEAHVGEKSWVGRGVTKWINVPSDSWLDTEFLLEELVADHHVVDHIFIMRSSLIVHAPAGIDELESSFGDQGSDIALDFLSLLVVPHGEEFHLNIGELSCGVEHQLLNNGCQDQIDLSMLLTLVATNIILINSLEPPNVVMGVSDEVDIQGLILIFPWLRRMEMLFGFSSFVDLIAPVSICIY